VTIRAAPPGGLRVLGGRGASLCGCCAWCALENCHDVPSLGGAVAGNMPCGGPSALMRTLLRAWSGSLVTGDAFRPGPGLAVVSGAPGRPGGNCFQILVRARVYKVTVGSTLTYFGPTFRSS